MEKKNNLKDCPLCGSSNVGHFMESIETINHGTGLVRCDNCGCCGFLKYWNFKDKVAYGVPEFRKDGYYWVKRAKENCWEVAKYTFGDQWELTGDNERYYDREIYKIDENIITMSK